MKIQTLTLSITLLTATSGAWSVQIVECEDDFGNRTFESACPPGTKQISQKKYDTGLPTAGEEPREGVVSAVLYIVSECENCNEVREYLTMRKVSISEKNVQDNVALQNELKQRAGQLRVPVTVIGEKVIIGYNRAQLAEALAAAGYAEEEGAGSGAEGEQTGEVAGAGAETEAATQP